MDDTLLELGLLAVAIFVPYVAPVKYAKYLNILGGVIKGTKKVVDTLDKVSKRIEDSKGGLSPELAKDAIVETTKDIAIKKLNEVVAPENKTEMITEQDFKKIGEVLVKSKGMLASASKVKDFLKSL